MAETSNRLLRTLGNLGLALLNATLILAALCLFLAWRVLASASDVTERFESALTGTAERIAPVAAELGALNEELGGLRAEIAALRAEAGDRGGAALAARLDALEVRLAPLDAGAARLSEMAGTAREAPGAVLDRAVDRAVAAAGAETTAAIARLRGCVPPEA
jgi:hypothetical protein